MTREIKFRAWWPGDRTMESWNEILDSSSPVVMRLYFHTDDEFPVILMQFTGLKDKNRKEIYEGDIVKFDASIFVDNPEDKECVLPIRFDSTGGFRPYYQGYGQLNWSANLSEVIGNIYENPELLQ